MSVDREAIRTARARVTSFVTGAGIEVPSYDDLRALLAEVDALEAEIARLRGEQ